MKKTFVLLLAGALLSASLDACEKADTNAPRIQRPIGEVTKYIVDFDYGNGLILNQQRVAAGDQLVRPANPAREGYIFVSWTKDIAGENPWNFDEDRVAHSMTLYAKWIRQ